MASETLDDVDKRIIYRLQQDARNNSATVIAEDLDVTANTVRNRIERLEEQGIITDYVPVIDYEQADYQLQVLIRCTAPVSTRTELAREVVEFDNVIAVRELMAGRRNLEITIVADESEQVTAAARKIDELGLEIEEEELTKNEYVLPFDKLSASDTTD